VEEASSASSEEQQGGGNADRIGYANQNEKAQEKIVR
jgi:hypothetical protein